MKATLVKKDDGYILFGEDNWSIGSTNHDNVKDVLKYKLSIENCKAIENGYDLNELVEDYTKNNLKPYASDIKSQNSRIHFYGAGIEGFKEGFKKALELMSDKKFGEDDIYRAFEEGERQDRSGLYDIIRPAEQTEWDVEIETEREEYILTPGGEGFEDQIYRGWRNVPKLDKDGCLILKIIKSE